MMSFLKILSIVSILFTLNLSFAFDGGYANPVKSGHLFFDGGVVEIVDNSDGSVTLLDSVGNLIGTIKMSRVEELGQKIEALDSEVEVSAVVKTMGTCALGYFYDPGSKQCYPKRSR
ncbi:MAG: hypothetical protein KDD37_00380 [Bdellovibrionales bacterium]|nr:hypothetical protein [Bdellovibrionales bacterium]